MARRSRNHESTVVDHESTVVDAELDGAVARATDRKAEDEGGGGECFSMDLHVCSNDGVGAEEIGRWTAAISTSAATASRWSALCFFFLFFCVLRF